MVTEARPPQGKEPRRRVLVVDDDRDFAESLGNFLLLEGYEVRTATDATQARIIVIEFEPQVAIVDYRLGPDDGLDVAQALRRVRPGLECILATAFWDTESAVGALRSGIYDYFRKPINPDELLVTLERCFEKLRLEEDKRAAEDGLRAAMESAEIANRAKSEFLANMSHEMRTPLNAIIGFSELLKEEQFGPIGEAKYRDYAADIHASGRHLLDLINDLLDLAKVESGADAVDDDTVDVGELVANTARMVRQRAELGNLRLAVEVEEGSPGLCADPRKLKQILVNLLSNAIKFTRSGGQVTLRVWSRQDSGYVFQVTDTGIGIASRDIAKALSKFGQVQRGSAHRHEGTGLGLPLAKALAEQHGGSLDLQSKVGSGTTVTVRFPAERMVARDPAAALVRSAAGDEGAR
jgi:signal transduction histidine kinase